MEAVPKWLRGAWSRGWIKKPAGTGLANASVGVLYVQTPSAFVDVRRPHVKGEPGAMAFAGVTSVDVGNLVSWHPCLNFDPPVINATACWKDADGGTPEPTEDQGVFVQSATNESVWYETAPDNSLEEEWHHLPSTHTLGCLAARHGTALLVYADGYFGFAEDYVNAEKRTQRYVAGTVLADGWSITHHCVDQSATESEEGTKLVLSTPLTSWQILEGSNLTWDDLPSISCIP
eukprot:m.53503 g.53503  ORF g.53503 m.53503 type:complete len:233 (+) comp21771_c0_seq1:462-1160(+)